MHFKRQICMEMIGERQYFTNDGYIIKAVTNVFDIKHS